MRFAFAGAATTVLVVCSANCSEGPHCGGGEFDILTPMGCVQAATVDCFLEDGGGAPDPFVNIDRCDGQSGIGQWPAITLDYSQLRNFEPTKCHVGITCANGSFEAYDIDWACGSAIATSPQIGFSGSGLTVCLHDIEDGGLDAGADSPPESATSDATQDAILDVVGN